MFDLLCAQMAIQLTYYRMHKKFVLTYESATTRYYSWCVYNASVITIGPSSNISLRVLTRLLSLVHSVDVQIWHLCTSLKSGYLSVHHFISLGCILVDKHVSYVQGQAATALMDSE